MFGFLALRFHGQYLPRNITCRQALFRLFLKWPGRNLFLWPRPGYACDPVNLRHCANVSLALAFVAWVIVDWSKILIFMRTAEFVRVYMVELYRLTRQEWHLAY